jgi:hypothetical protein
MRIRAHEALKGAPLDGVVRRRLTSDHDLDIFIVNDPIEGRLSLEIGNLPAELRLPTVEVGDVIELKKHQAAGLIRLSLINPTYKDVFLVLVDDIVDWVERNPGVVSGSHAAIQRLRRWERLLQASSRGLSLSAQKGLIGELRVLGFLIDAIGAQDALDGWKGPIGGQRDFEIGGVAVEVKATSSGGLLTAKISSERQLETEHLDRLYLWCVELESNENGSTLGDAVDAAIEKLRSTAGLLEELRDRLLSVGYQDEMRDQYVTRFVVRGDHVYAIEEDFPRITSSDVPEAVFDVRYSLDLEACERFSRAPSDIWSRNVE